jgi:hypothetical protein
MTVSVQKHLNQALMRIPRRAESTDRALLAQTYVSAGSFSAILNSADHQILYGRRGTGKTHALLYLSDLVEQVDDFAIYLDLRTIGSTGGLYADNTMTPAERGTHLLIDTIEAIHEQLLTIAIERDITDNINSAALLPALDAVADAATTIEVIGQVEHETTHGEGHETSTQLGITAATQPHLTATSSRKHSSTAQNRKRRTGIERHRVLFGPLSRALRAVTRSLDGRRLWLLLDEWSSVPLELQPLLADLLRRSILPVPGITVKIAAIERRSRFAIPNAGDYLGIEVGADAASAVSLDDFMILDHTADNAQEFFRQLFYNHTSTKIKAMFGGWLGNPAALIGEIFSRNSFPELVRAAEGIPRDAINVAALAAQHANEAQIDLIDIRRGARDWYLRDKLTAINANEGAHQVLQNLVDEVVGRRHSRTFVLDHETSARHTIVNELYDARLLHVLRRGLVDHQHPGRLYDGFAIDYGCYVSLLEGDTRHRPRDRGGWLASVKGVPPDGFNLSKTAIDVSILERR